MGTPPYRADDIGVCLGTLVADTSSYDGDAFVETARVAAAAGFPSVALWSHTATAFGPDAARRVVDDAGLSVGAVEAALQWWSGPDEANADAGRHLDVASALGADILLAAHLAPADSFARTVDGFATLCERAREHDVRVCIEWVPQFGVPDLATAWRLVEEAGAANGGLCLDWLYWQLQPGGPDHELLAAIPADRLHYVQVCDAPGTAPASPGDLVHMATHARPFPGDGVIDIPPLLATLEGMGAAPFLAYEQFNVEAARAGPVAMAARIRENARSIFG